MVWPQILMPEKSMPSVLLEGKSLYLRPPQLSDWAQWADVRGRNETRLKPLEPSWATDSLSQDFYKTRLHRQQKEWHEERAHALLIFKYDNTLIGGMNINNICRGAAQYAAIGYWIDKSHEGQGFMSEALQLTKAYCFENLKLHRINAACLLGNARSISLLLKNGFEKEGLAKRYLHINGAWQDHVLFGTCIEDYI